MRDEAGEPRLGGEQVVVARVAPALVDVVADRSRWRAAVVEEARSPSRAAGRRCCGQALELDDALARGIAAPAAIARSAPWSLAGAGQLAQRRDAIGRTRAWRRRRATTARSAAGPRARRAHCRTSACAQCVAPRRATAQSVGFDRDGAAHAARASMRSASRQRLGDACAQAASSCRCEGRAALVAARLRRRTPRAPGRTCRPARRNAHGDRIGASRSASRPWRSVSRWPARLPLSTVET